MSRQPFDLDAELQKAWDWCWTYYCEPSEYRPEEYDNDGMPTGKLTGEVRIIEPRQQWLTATELERRVRAACAEILEGAPYGSYGADAWGHRVRISTGGYRTNLLGDIRTWLANQIARGVLTGHNFGKGHCSGMRCRPVNVPLTEAEKSTAAKKEKRARGETPVHFYDDQVKGWPSKSLCSRAMRATQRAKYRGYSRGTSRSHTRITREAAKVTCPRCLKLLAATAKGA